MIRAVKATGVLVVAVVFVALSPGAAHATPPNIPSYSTAVTRLAALTVAAESHSSTYNRDLFPHCRVDGGNLTRRPPQIRT